MITTFGNIFNNKPYLTSSDSKYFSQMMKDGRATIFNISKCQCEGCEKYVPKGVKKYCSKTCFEKEEGYNEETNEETNSEETW